ncbi:MAG: hypothetical protein ABIU05_25940, partial [Nitrospirales bacterium]
MWVSFHPPYRARSASKKGTWPLPSHASATARCTSTGDHLVCPLLPLLLLDDHLNAAVLGTPRIRVVAG